MRRIMRIFALSYCLSILLIPAVSNSSGDAGFRLKYKDFSLSIRFNIIDNEVVDNSNDFLFYPEKMFYECAHWVFKNQEQLDKSKSKLTVLFYPKKSKFVMWDEENENAVKEFSYDRQAVSKEMLFHISKKAGIEKNKCQYEGSIPLYQLISEELIAVPKSPGNSSNGDQVKLPKNSSGSMSSCDPSW